VRSGMWMGRTRRKESRSRKEREVFRVVTTRRLSTTKRKKRPKREGSNEYRKIDSAKSGTLSGEGGPTVTKKRRTIYKDRSGSLSKKKSN